MDGEEHNMSRISTSAGSVQPDIYVFDDRLFTSTKLNERLANGLLQSSRRACTEGRIVGRNGH